VKPGLYTAEINWLEKNILLPSFSRTPSSGNNIKVEEVDAEIRKTPKKILIESSS